MSINWFTVIAQIINFLILVWLMKHFLYRPILNAIDAREKQIADTMADSEEIGKKAAEARDHFRSLNEDLENNYKKLLNNSKAKAQLEYEGLMEKARQDASELKQKQQETLKQDDRKLKQFIQQRTKEELFALLEKTLNDLADVSLETQMVTAFLGRLKELTGDEKERLAAIKKGASKKVIIQTAFDLASDQRKTIQKAIRDLLNIHGQIYFETDPHLINGIKLIVADQEIAWSIDRYLESFENQVNELLNVTQSEHYE